MSVGLLAFARRQQLQPADIDIAELARRSAACWPTLWAGWSRSSGGSRANLWQAFADPAQLELALMNLVINARDAMPDGGTILVAAENRMIDSDQSDGLKPGDYVVLSVCDTGCGIPAEMIEKVLEPFVTTKDVGKGTGLGLSMVYGFARQSNGAFRLTSEVGVGTERANLAAARGQGRKGAQARSSGCGGRKRPVTSGSPGRRPCRSARGNRRDARGPWAQVSAAGIGSEALDLISSDKEFDLLITDYAMPQLSGTELVGKVAQAHPRPAVDDHHRLCRQ